MKFLLHTQCISASPNSIWVQLFSSLLNCWENISMCIESICDKHTQRVLMGCRCENMGHLFLFGMHCSFCMRGSFFSMFGGVHPSAILFGKKFSSDVTGDGPTGGLGVHPSAILFGKRFYRFYFFIFNHNYLTIFNFSYKCSTNNI